MACGSCGSASKVQNDYAVMVDGREAFRGTNIAEARIWIAKNASGKRATVKPVAKSKK